MIAEVRLWGRTIGAVSMNEERDYAAFQYTPEFAASGIEVAPLTLPLSNRVYEFPELSRNTFRGLPGLLADSLPDRFGNTLIDAWLATEAHALARRSRWRSGDWRTAQSLSFWNTRSDIGNQTVCSFVLQPTP